MAGWVRIDDDFPLHPKARAAGKDGRSLHVAAICWSNRNLTDGIIPKDAVAIVAAEATVKPSVAKVCVDAGLWHDCGDHYELHNYLERNRSKDQIEKERARWRTSKGIPRDSRVESVGETPVTPVASQVTGGFGSTNNKSSRLASVPPVDNHDDEVHKVLEAIVKHKVKTFAKKNPLKYEASCWETVGDEYGIDALRAVVMFPGAPVQSLAAHVMGENVPSLSSFRVSA